MSGIPRNATLDDACPAITYSGWTSGGPSSADPDPASDVIRNGHFFHDTVSYTSTRGASAKLSFEGSALYIFGVTGPNFGSYGISIDGGSVGVWSSSSRSATYNALLWRGAGWGPGNHTVEITNRSEGKMLALDYFVCTKPEEAGNVPVGGPFADGEGGHHGNGSAAAVIGGILGGLAVLLVLLLAWRYYQWKKAGGEGDIFQACFGSLRKAPPPPPAPASQSDFKVWPMLRSRPKYDT